MAAKGINGKRAALNNLMNIGKTVEAAVIQGKTIPEGQLDKIITAGSTNALTEAGLLGQKTVSNNPADQTTDVHTNLLSSKTAGSEEEFVSKTEEKEGAILSGKERQELALQFLNTYPGYSTKAKLNVNILTESTNRIASLIAATRTVHGKKVDLSHAINNIITKFLNDNKADHDKLIKKMVNS